MRLSPQDMPDFCESTRHEYSYLLFVNDDTDQAAAARRLLDASREFGKPRPIAPHTRCELVWVLNAVFRLPQTEVVDIVQMILVSEVWLFEREQLIQRALDSYRLGRADFPDYLIGEPSAASGCRDTVTFFKSLKGSPGFALL
jgi:predicted nucleic-acid-binding protein